jgi:signal peptidase I
MFGLFQSQEKKMRENAANWLELADKVYHYRRDVLPANQLTELQSHIATLQQLLAERAGPEKLKLEIERLEEVLRRTGGAIYPKTALTENVEFFLVAAIVILGIRTYFVQPFKIPTNSMWPTYNGMTPEVWSNPADTPGALTQVLRFVSFGAKARRVEAPADGEITIPLYSSRTDATIPFREVPARTWLVFPTTVKEYTLMVGDRPARVQVPVDFDFEWAIRDAYFADQAQDPAEPGRTTLARAFAKQESGGRFAGSSVLHTGRTVKAGERMLSFDIITGDQLFVDRASYHFVRPRVGQGFVFRTDHINSPYMQDRGGAQLEQYYIKRLVGTPGDTLEIREPALYRNGAPISGSAAFGANAKREGKYRGYVNFNFRMSEGYLRPGETITVPAAKYFALGDNSTNSQDGRYWGFVPAKDVVGRPLFVYYPFTRHWGPAR